LDGHQHSLELHLRLEASVVLYVLSRGWGCWKAASIQVAGSTVSCNLASASYHLGILGVEAGPVNQQC
jgi:hypothetical protein